MIKILVFFYSVFEVSSTNNEAQSNIKINGPSNLSPQTIKRTAELIYLINKQFSDEEKDNLDFKDEEKFKVDLDYYNTGYEDRKKSILQLMHLVQKNYDASFKFDENSNNDVRIHIISNPDVLKKFKKKLRNNSNLSSVNSSSEYNDTLKNDRNSKSRKAVFYIDSVSREKTQNYNEDDAKSTRELEKQLEESIKDNLNGKLVKAFSDDGTNKKVFHEDFKVKDVENWDDGTNLKRAELVQSLEGYRKGDVQDWHRRRDSKENDSREKEKPRKEWIDYVTPENWNIDNHRWDGKERTDKDDWSQTRKSKSNRWEDNETTKRDMYGSWEKKRKSIKVKNKEDDWSQVGIPKNLESNKKTTNYHTNYDREDNIKNKWSSEVPSGSKNNKNSISRSGKSKHNESSDKSREKGKKSDDYGKNYSWDNWSEKKPKLNWAKKNNHVKKEQDRYMVQNDHRPKNVKAVRDNYGRSGFGRTPIPLVGKKSIYDD